MPASVKDDLEKLKDELSTIIPVYRDADNKQFGSVEAKKWICEFDQVAYDVEDLIDMHRAKQRRPNTVSEDSRQEEVRRSLLPRLRSSLLSCFLCCPNVPHLHQTGKEIKAINDRLSSLTRKGEWFGFRSIIEESALGVNNVNETWIPSRETDSLISETLIGREDDEKKLVQWLLEEVEEGGENPKVVGIVGMGGLGKTTLARMVYNRNAVTKHFDLRMWVCLSMNPDPLVLSKKVLEDIVRTESGAREYRNLNSLKSEISDHLRGKRFLLVLDDVWDVDWWTQLNGFLQAGASGSKVLITTRDKSVLEKLNVYEHLHELKGLPVELSWRLFCSKALQKGETDEELDRDGVKTIGREIVDKCNGLPLAINVVGSYLRSS